MSEIFRSHISYGSNSIALGEQMRLNIFACIVAATAAVTSLTFRPDPARACNPNGYVGSICWTAIPYCPKGYERADGRFLLLEKPFLNSKTELERLNLVISHEYGTSTDIIEGSKQEDPPKDWKLTGHDSEGNIYRDAKGKEHHSSELIKPILITRKVYAIPDLRGHEPVGTGTGRGLAPISAGSVNSNGFNLETAMLPAHDHGVKFEAAVDVAVSEKQATERVPTGNVFATLENSDYAIYDYPANWHMASDVITANIIGKNISTDSSINEATSSKPGSNLVHIVPPQLGMLACINVGGNFPPIPATEDKKPAPQGGTTP
jgi:microcystin-dependent protein|tara:strand:+ start:408 stop:1367 length:960 start_codon:yes stop_codon:yes gene_type:complete